MVLFPGWRTFGWKLGWVFVQLVYGPRGVVLLLGLPWHKMTVPVERSNYVPVWLRLSCSGKTNALSLNTRLLEKAPGKHTEVFGCTSKASISEARVLFRETPVKLGGDLWQTIIHLRVRGGVNLKDKMACSLGMNGDNYNIHCSCLDLAITTSANIQKPDCHLSAIQRLLSVVWGGIAGSVTPTTYYHDTISAYCFRIVGCTKTIDLLIPDFQIHLHVPRTRAITSNRSAKIYLQFRRLGVYRFDLLWTEHQL